MPLLFPINLQTKFEMSSFIRSKDMAWPKNVEMGHVTMTTPNWEILHAANKIWKSLALAVPKVFQGV